MSEPLLNLAAWIDRRKADVGPYAYHIIHSVQAYEAHISALQEQNRALREALEAIASMEPHHAGQTPNEYHMQQIALAATKQEGGE